MLTSRQNSFRLSVFLLLGASCTGTIGDATGASDDGAGASSGSGGRGSGGPFGGGGTGVDPLAPESAGPFSLRRLSAREYNNTIADLLGNELAAMASALSSSLPLDSPNDGGFEVPGEIAGNVNTFWNAAEKLAQSAAPKLAAQCDAAKVGEATCAQQIIVGLGRRTFRRPVEKDEIATFQTLFDKARSADVGYDYTGSIALVIQAMLQSPNFLYHWEVGSARPVREKDGLVKLSDHQVASRLSYLLWGTMPDPELFAAADAKQLGDADGVAKQVKRMIGDKHFTATAADFHRQWMSVGHLENMVKDANRYGDFNQDKAATVLSMDGELVAFSDYVLRQGDGTLRTLLTGRAAGSSTPFSFLDDALAKIYGYTGAVGPNLTKKDLNPKERAGVLTQAAFLAKMANDVTSRPVKRGVWVWTELLCRGISPPPDAAAVDKAKMAMPFTPDQVTREYFERLTAAGACRGCHQLMNPFGFSLEHYGAIGEYRKQDGGKAVNASGTVTLDGKEVKFDDAIQLFDAMAASADVRRCVTSKWFRYALGRREGDAERPSLESVVQRFTTSGGDLRQMLLAIAGTKVFRYRAPTAGEPQ